MNTFGFWLLPPKKIQAEYQPLIDKYSKRLKTPSFEPHITIFGGVKEDEKKIVKKVERITSKLKPIQITFSDITVSTTYHQCVFARVKPTTYLLDTHLEFKATLGDLGKKMYVPHMSLVYGNMSTKEKNEIADEIKLTTNSFKADRFCLVNTDDFNPKTWIHVSEFQLNH